MHTPTGGRGVRRLEGFWFWLSNNSGDFGESDSNASG